MINPKEFIEKRGEKKILNQIQEEYKICYDYFSPRLSEWLIRLSVYNNQKRDKKKTGDPLLFTIFQTVLASLYSDRLVVRFEPREIGDVDVAKNLNKMMEFDYERMEKNILDYEWIWDSQFFGRGLILLQEFDREKMHPIPQVIDPCTFLRDPRATSVNGNLAGHNALRFWGREIALTKHEMEQNPVYFNINKLKVGKDLRSLLQKASKQRQEAQGLDIKKEDELKENVQYDLLEWYTHINGEKYIITLGNDKTEIVRITKLNEKKWALIDRPFFPSSHSWEGVSIPDLVEDKQRARAVLQNLVLDSAKADVNPMYLFDETRIRNRADLNFGFNKFIRVQGPTTGAVTPMHKPTVHAQVAWIMDLLDFSSQRALATPEIQMGMVTPARRTLGEIEIVAGRVDTRYSLAARIFGWSDKKFWQQWYYLYKNHFKERIDEKIIRITGMWGVDFRTLKRENIIAKVDPDVKVESNLIAQSKKIQDRNKFMNYLGIVINDPNINRRFAFKELAKLNDFKDYKIDMLFPPTIDEMEAEKENEILEKEFVGVDIRQDHQSHLLIHSKINRNKFVDAHLDTHRVAMLLKRKYLALFQEQMAEIKMPGAPVDLPDKSPEKAVPKIATPPVVERKARGMVE